MTMPKIGDWGFLEWYYVILTSRSSNSLLQYSLLLNFRQFERVKSYTTPLAIQTSQHHHQLHSVNNKQHHTVKTAHHQPVGQS